MNNTQLIGRLTKDVDFKYTAGGNAVANFILAVNRTYKNKDGGYDADFIRVQAWRKLAENVANHVGKGSLVGITGTIRTRHYDDDDGKRVYITEVIANSVQFLDPKGKNTEQSAQGQQYSNANHAGQASDNDQSSIYDHDPFSVKGGPIEVSDDDLPF